MEAVILAGGLGTRLSSVLKELPKPMAPVGGKPFLEYILRWLALYKISKIVIGAGYKADKITSCFGKNFDKVPIEYSLETEPLGTGGAVLKATERIEDDDFLVVNGDTYFPVNLGDFHGGHMSMRGDITVALREMTDFSRFGAVELGPHGTIISFNEKEFRSKGLINGGIYFINKKFLTELDLPLRFSLEKDVLEKHVGGKMKGMVFRCPFIDIGIPEDYFRAQVVL